MNQPTPQLIALLQNTDLPAEQRAMLWDQVSAVTDMSSIAHLDPRGAAPAQPPAPAPAPVPIPVAAQPPPPAPAPASIPVPPQAPAPAPVVAKSSGKLAPPRPGIAAPTGEAAAPARKRRSDAGTKRSAKAPTERDLVFACASGGLIPDHCRGYLDIWYEITS